MLRSYWRITSVYWRYRTGATLPHSAKKPPTSILKDKLLALPFGHPGARAVARSNVTMALDTDILVQGTSIREEHWWHRNGSGADGELLADCTQTGDEWS